jgi:hypothetical protein
MRVMRGGNSLNLFYKITNVNRMVDMMMMSLMNGKERELDQWKALFEQADPRFKWNGGIKPDGSRLCICIATWEP